MSKSNSLYMDEISKRDELIQELANGLRQCVKMLEIISLTTGVGYKSDLSTLKVLIAKTEV